MVESRASVEHLLSCVDAVYRALGESAPRLSEDAYVVAVHEMSRSFGALALAMRQYVGASDVEPMAVILEVLDRALDSDPTGAMTLFAMALVVGPRLLVSLRDARASLTGDEALSTLLENAAQVTVAQLLLIATVTHNQENIDDPAWQAAARALTTTVEKAGNAESFGLSR
jgi:hypothetical protein